MALELVGGGIAATLPYSDNSNFWRTDISWNRLDAYNIIGSYLGPPGSLQTPYIKRDRCVSIIYEQSSP